MVAAVGHLALVAMVAGSDYAGHRGGGYGIRTYPATTAADLAPYVRRVSVGRAGYHHDLEVRRLPAVEHFEDVPAQPDGFDWQGGLVDAYGVDLLARGYYLNDQRIQWSGLEETFGAEAVLAGWIRHYWGPWEATVEGEFYLNQPFNRNILLDTPERASYAGNFDVDTLEISKLLVGLRRGDLLFAIGKMETPFGRTHFPLFTNARLDAPFIRTESILWRETGVLVRYEPGCLVADVAVVNGSEDRDTNSSKGLVSRIGIEDRQWGAGVSVKIHDGIGSEGQKMFNNHVGMDFMLRRGPFTVSAEMIYDEYGFRRPGFDPLDITWGRSIYYRDQNYRLNVPITGIGYYLNLGFQGRRWAGVLNYGEFYPQQLGDPRHDTPNRRGIITLAYGLTSHLAMYCVAMVENGGYVAQAGRRRRGVVVLAGFQYRL